MVLFPVLHWQGDMFLRRRWLLPGISTAGLILTELAIVTMIGLYLLGRHYRSRRFAFSLLGFWLFAVSGFMLSAHAKAFWGIRYQEAVESSVCALSDLGVPRLVNDTRPFRIEGSDLHIRPSPRVPEELVLPLPEALTDPKTWTLPVSWTIRLSADGRRLICLNARGLAVWRACAPHELLHSWSGITDPLAGPVIYFDDGENYRIRTVAYRVSPDGRLACVHPVSENCGTRDSEDGVVLIRDLETGDDVARLAHAASQRTLTDVAWSGDSRRLATYNALWELPFVAVWDVSRQVRLACFRGLFHEFALSHDGELLFATSGSPEQELTLRRVADGVILRTRRFDSLGRMILSPDEKHLLVIGSRRGEGLYVSLLDSSTLREIWSSPCPGWRRVAFRPDGKELAVAWGGDGLPFMWSWGSGSGVRVWDTARGTVVLDAPIMLSSWRVSKGSTYDVGIGWTEDGGILAGKSFFAATSQQADRCSPASEKGEIKSMLTFGQDQPRKWYYFKGAR